jgi:hypothetical protein
VMLEGPRCAWNGQEDPKVMQPESDFSLPEVDQDALLVRF